jgi:ligand-binding SRPBCC domain-containing protein
MHIYEKRSIIHTTMERMIAFHQDPSTMPKLSPPPIFVKIHRDERISLIEGELEFTLWFGPIPVHWVARHEPGPTGTSFSDVMVKGPMAHWRHEHIFEEDSQGITLIDRVTLTHKPGLPGVFTRLMFAGLPLRILFFYRHLVTRLTIGR